jgi:hypothetical protein
MSTMFVVLPPIALLSLWYLIHQGRQLFSLQPLSRRGSLVVAFIVMQALVAIISEAASVRHHFTLEGIGLAWVVLDLVLLIAVVCLGGADLDMRAWRRTLSEFLRGTTVWERVLVTAGAAAMVVLIALGALYVPSNGDSLVYHLARVAQWLQNGSVAQYATHYPAQIELSPLHEYNMAQVQLLVGTDRLDGYLQLLGVVICVVGATEIARLLGARRNGQVLAAALTATLPSLLLEATSTQNNDFAAAASVGLLLVTMVWRPAGRYLPGAALIGLAGAVAVLTKGTVIAMMLPTGLLLIGVNVGVRIRRVGFRPVAPRLLIGGAAALFAAVLVAGPFFARNEHVYGGLTGPTSRTTISYDLTTRAATANVIRSTASNFAIGDGHGPESWFSRTVLGGLEKAYEPLRVDQADWHYSVGGLTDAFAPADYSGWQRTEELGANPWHVCLIVATVFALIMLVAQGNRRLWAALLVATGLMLGFVLFSATARWSPYAVRYSVPLLVAWCPLIALILERVHKAVSGTVVVALVLLAQPMLLDNVARSVIHPAWSKGHGIERYYHPWVAPDSVVLAQTADAQTALAQALAQSACPQLGIANWVLFEYPMWVALEQAGWRGRVEHVDVTNASRKLADPNFVPCARVRQVEPSYVTADAGTASLRFGDFAVSIDPALADGIAADAPGFTSDLAGVRLRPGTGWALGAAAPVLDKSAKLYLMADAAHLAHLHLDGPTAALSLATPAGSRAQLLAQKPTAAGLEATVLIKPGINELSLTSTTGDRVAIRAARATAG